MINTFIHVLVTVLFPPLLLGVVNKVKAKFAGRVGPRLLQPYDDLARLLRKDSVFSSTTSSIFRLSPVVGVTAGLTASLLVPLGRHAAPWSFTGDLVLFLYLFAVARFFMVTAALDTGSAFEGMGGAREAAFSCLAEPAVLMALLVLVKRSGSLSLGTMLGPVEGHGPFAPVVVAVVSLFIVLLAENCRIPFDDPNTHLELTMIHEVMVLDHSGPSFGFVLYGAALKLFVQAAIVAQLALPLVTRDAWLNWAIFLGAMVAIAVAIGIVESVMARLRLRQVPSLLVAACLLSGFGVILLSR